MSDAFVLEDNVPVPEKKNKLKGESKYPFASMQIGQSFFVKCDEDRVKATMSSLGSSARKFLEKSSLPETCTFVVRPSEKVVDGFIQKGIRIWLVDKSDGNYKE